MSTVEGMMVICSEWLSETIVMTLGDTVMSSTPPLLVVI
jgi:hypothetical protein